MATYESENEGTVVASFPKNAFEEVKVTVGPYKGQTLVDARVWRNGADHPIPTRKGLSIRPELLPELVSGLLAAMGHVNDDAASKSTQSPVNS